MTPRYRHEVRMSFGREFVFLTSWDAMKYEEETKREPLDRHMASFHVRRWLDERGQAAHDLRAAFREDFTSRHRGDSDAAIIEAFHFGHWKVYELPVRERQSVKVGDVAATAPKPYVPPPPPPPSTETRPEKTWFEVKVVDEFGKPIDGLEVVFSQGSKQEKLETNGAGVVRWRDVQGPSTAWVNVANLATLREKLKPRYAKGGDRKTPDGADVTKVMLGIDEPGKPLSSELPGILVMAKPLTRVRLIGMHFDTNKCFLREPAMHGIRKVVAVYKANPTGKLLIVGHTDTVDTEAYNLDLSVERADAVKAYLKDDVAAWEAWFGDGKPDKKRWGQAEITHMIAALPCPQSVTGFQNWSNETRGTVLKVDGDAGPKTRKALIEAYMALDDTTLPAAIAVEVHGVGEWFPRTDDGDAFGKDGVAAAENRRVEIFCFPDDIVPPSPGKKGSKNEPQYPNWQKQVTSTYDVDTGEFLSISVRLSCDQRRHIPNAIYRTSQNWKNVRHADVNGWIALEVDPKATLTIEWDKPEFPNRFAFRQMLALLAAPADDDGAAKRRLEHLGYAGNTLEELVADYQYKFGREVTGRLEDIQEELVRWHDGGPRPVGASSPA